MNANRLAIIPNATRYNIFADARPGEAAIALPTSVFSWNRSWRLPRSPARVLGRPDPKMPSGKGGPKLSTP